MTFKIGEKLRYDFYTQYIYVYMCVSIYLSVYLYIYMSCRYIISDIYK